MMQATTIASAGEPEARVTRRPLLGWGISLLAHAIGIVWLWHAAPPRPANPDTRPARQMEVWLLPAVAVAPSDPAPTRAAQDRTPTRRLRQPRASAPSLAPVMSQPPAEVATPPARSSRSDTATTIEGATPAFDLSAARASARAMVRADGTGAAGLPLRQEKMKATTSDRIQERFERARRADCLKGTDSVNLLANVIALGKNVVANAVDDSGCKL